MTTEAFNKDFREMLESLNAVGARYLVIGAHAVAAWGSPRATGDLDIWIDSSHANSELVWEALLDFGVPVEALGVTVEDFRTPDMVVQIGQPPRRIDFLTRISGATFEDAWPSKKVAIVDGIRVPYLGREELIRNKRAAGRLKDLADVEAITSEPSDG